MEKDRESSNERDTPGAHPTSTKVSELKAELKTLKNLNDAVQGKVESSDSRQGCLGFAIVGTTTILGAILGFGLLSIVTGIGGFVIGTMISASLLKDKPEKIEYEVRKRRIQEIETLLSQVG